MRHFLRILLLTAALSALFLTQASALEFTYDAPEDYLFGRPTSEDIVYKQQENPNVDRSKNTALIAPGFGTPTSYLPGSGEYLTPNLVPGALDGGLVNQVGNVNYPAVDVSGGVSVTNGETFWTSAQPAVTSYTEVTPDLYYANGSLGTLNIPVIGLTVKVVQGTDSAALAQGAGHFEDTSIWSGNICLAGHNRGVTNHFGKIHTLSIGDIITLTTKLGTRDYSVTSVSKISATDRNGTSATTGNQITLYTCVMDEPDYRWCVVGTEV